MVKRLATHYGKDEASADAVNGLLKKFNLTVIAPRLLANVRAHVVQQERYKTVHVRTTSLLDSTELQTLRTVVGAPHDAPIDVTVDPTMLRGTEVSYGGKKWSSNAKEKLNRFVHLK